MESPQPEPPAASLTAIYTATCVPDQVKDDAAVPLNKPGSQESYVSHATLQSSSSNVSNATEFTSPASSNGSRPTHFTTNKEKAALEGIARLAQPDRPVTPQMASPSRSTSASGGGSGSMSPPSAGETRLSKAAKRTSSGMIKAPSLPPTVNNPLETPARGHVRNRSDASTSSRIGELSAQLKTRLSYAMVKVQNGWEKHSLEELETLPSARATPGPVTPGADSSPWRRSRGYSNASRRLSTASEVESRYLTSPSSVTGSPFRAAGTYYQSVNSSRHQPYPQPLPSKGVGLGLGLAPAPDLASPPPRQRRRSSFTTRAPAGLISTRKQHSSDLTGLQTMPTTPIATSSPRRQGILRMPSQQAEKDAVDTLLFMSGSPNTSANMKFSNAGGAQPSPLRAEFPLGASVALKRVAFEGDAEPGRAGSAGEEEWLKQLKAGAEKR